MIDGMVLFSEGLGASGLSEDNQCGRQSIWSGDRDLECEEDRQVL